MSDEITPRNDTPPHKPSRPARFLKGLILPLLILAAALLAWMYFPAIQEAVQGTSTPTALLATETPTLPPPPTETSIPQPTSQPTATLLPTSAYQREANMLDPKLPGQGDNVIILNEDTSVTADPGFDQLGWYSSQTIAEQIGRVINEPFFATTSAGAVVWKMDKPLQPGLYEIYVLDTVYSSAGGLDFRVLLGDRELSPLLGNQHLQYRLQSGMPAQLSDEWAYLGMFDLDSPDLLSVMTAWEARDMSTIVAIDRVMIVKRQDSLRTFLQQLPANMPKYVIDDTAAQIESSASWFTRTDLPAWGDACQVVINPQYNSTITWDIPGQVPAGNYDIWVWVPEINGDSDLVFTPVIDGEDSPSTVIANTQIIPGGQWVSLGTWDVVSDNGFAKLSLKVQIPRETIGEVAIDAVAFIRR